ncbi:MAG: helix-turn-helix transcriptional regulator [Thermoanaerobaculia bacterium]|nr:helix-turn-helix transcriptional regulator [Thermoanaerobaculia bacterium]
MSGTPLGNHIRRLRFEHGEISQETLAQAVGITRQTVIALEQRRYAPSLELAMKLALVFGRSVDDVFFWSDAPPDLSLE